MAAKYESPSEYIAHHLTFATHGGDDAREILRRHAKVAEPERCAPVELAADERE